MRETSLFREIVVDNFAGGGGASKGIEMATGLSVDVAINHDPAAIAMHKANHPETEHYCESVWNVDPKEVVRGRKVGLCWLSPDCKHFSKAKGGKPVNKEIRGLAWIAVKWAILVRPRVIMLENVEEFKTWGPLKQNDKGEFVPDPSKKGMTFQSFKKSLEALGYQVETRELVACDYGAPTSRKRLFLVARCDGKQIQWPKQTHADPNELTIKLGLKPYRESGEVIDWSLPIPSIFSRKKPLKENTLLRISRGMKKFVIETDKPYIVNDKAYFLQHYYTHQSNEIRASSLHEPLATIPTANRFGLVAAFLTKYYGQGIGQTLHEPMHTIPTKDRFGLVTAFMTKYYGNGVGHSLFEPVHTITSGGNKFGIVTVHGEKQMIADIGMRMLQPHELFKAQGFPEDYIIDRDHEGRIYPKTQQVARCGNSVPPPFAEALVRANLPEMCVKKEEVAV
ncbi:DNA cytosine methyltransferase [Evansella tamaricis]|uniref:DNA cytosine methyltransferase n=1 Tax=Evansella tamaricis TaxID=2069301 RepID=A0ABS6JBP7_9BACI|nr:DNA cytosine methyltransferase [Evansella tamaricis]